jgi:hypothetical protein
MNSMLSLAAIVAVGVILFLALGCTAHQQYRTRFDPPAGGSNLPNQPDSVVEEIEGCKLGFVEIDDQGWFWDRRQWDAVQAMVTQAAALDQAEGAQPILIVLFVHGWKHDARTDDENVVTFRQTVAALSAAEKTDSEQEGRAPRKVVGVYAGWRGLSATWEPFKELSFYERKNTAHKVGHGAMTELLVRLEGLETLSNSRLRKSRANPPQADEPGTEFMVVGHSFGGAAVYSALSQVLVERFIEDTNHGRVLKPFGSLIILINPAFEASLYNDLNELATSLPGYPPEQRPVMAIFTSKADWATKYAFSAGRFFSTLFEEHRTDKPQRQANLTAVGHFAPFTTHDLVYDPKATDTALPPATATAPVLPPVPAAAATPTTAPAPKPAPTTDAKAAFAVMRDPARLRVSTDNVRKLRRQWTLANTASTMVAAPREYSFDDCRLVARSTYKAGDPFLVVSVDKEIIRDHNDIAEPVFINFLREFIGFSRKNSPPPDNR